MAVDQVRVGLACDGEVEIVELVVKMRKLLKLLRDLNYVVVDLLLNSDQTLLLPARGTCVLVDAPIGQPTMAYML